MNVNETTPLPWTSAGKEQTLTTVYGADGQPICDMLATAAPGDGALIARAVNGYAAMRDALQKVLADLDALISDSHGVVGLHRNGDVATWSELTDGGRFNEWLSLGHARAALSGSQVTTPKVRAGQWVVAGTNREDLDWGRVFEHYDSLHVSWESSQCSTPAPTMDGGDWPSDVEVHATREAARAAFEARYSKLGE